MTLQIPDGIYTNLEDPIYRADAGVSISDLKLMRISPLYFHDMKYGGLSKRKSTKALELGSLVHMAVLEPERMDIAVCVEPSDAPSRPTAAQQAAAKPSAAAVTSIEYWKKWDDEHAGMECFDQKIMNQAIAMRDSIMANVSARKYLSGSSNEVSVITRRVLNTSCGDVTVRLRGRIDCVPTGPNLVDIKTVGLGGASKEEFSKQIAEYDYHLQAAYYLDLYNSRQPYEWDQKTGFVFIAIEKEPPYGVALHRLTPRSIEQGREEYNRMLASVAECIAANTWPMYPEWEQEIDLPPWATKKG